MSCAPLLLIIYTKRLSLSVTTPFKTSVKYKIKFINKPHNKTLKLGIKSVYKTV